MRMRRVLGTLVTAATAAVVVTVAPATATTVAPHGRTGAGVSVQTDRPGLQDRLDQVVAAGAVGALAEVRDEHGRWRGTSGVARIGKTQPVPLRGRFRVGSITKTFVATVVLQLVDEGRLRLDDTVQSWLPGVVPGGQRITVRELLNQTSGLYDYLHTLPMPPSAAFLGNRWRTWTAAELVQRAVAHPPTSEPPGSAFAYSNTNYILLGEIIEKVTGYPYRQQIQRRIIRPLRLHDTAVPGTSPWIRGPHPHGYVPTRHQGKTRLLDYTAMNPSVMGASGAIISTTSDLNRFYAALLGGRLLPVHLLDAMKTPGRQGSPYGLGMFVRSTSCGVRLYGHDGDALSYQAWSYSTADGDRQVTVALTPNFTGDTDETVDALIDKAICG